MPAGLPGAFLLLAQASYGPAPVKPPQAAAAPAAALNERDCVEQNKDPNAQQIVICAPKPQGYRLPPDVLEARRMKKQGDSVRPKNQRERFAENNCAVGPMGCTGVPAVNFIAMAAVAAQISERLAKGQEIGSIFETTPASGEYAYYREAKREREEKEAEAAAAKVKAAAEAQAAINPSTSR